MIKTCLGACLVAAGLLLALAAHADHTAAHDAAAADSDAARALQDANMKMHSAMDIPATGDADVDFVRGMLAHHQGAVDMAKVVLKYGSDPDVRMLAGDIIKAQDKEMAWMREWLLKHGPKGLSFGEDGAEKAPAPAGEVPPPPMGDIMPMETPAE